MLPRGPYDAAVLEPIAGLEPGIDGRTQALVETATVEMVRFDAELGHGTSPFATLLLRSESAASSEIEKLTAGSKKIALARLGDTSSGNARMIVSNVAAVQLSDELTVENITTMHLALMEDSEPEIAGRIRETQVWIRGNSPHTSDFVPPHHERVPEALEDLAVFMQREDVPALTQAAIAHAQFETIHPFVDGNGRTGRAIVSSILRNKGITRNVTIPVSSGLLTNTPAYFDSLTAYREGNPQPIIELFAESSFSAMDNGLELAEDISRVREEYKDRLGRTRSPAVQTALNLLMSEPAITAEMVRTHTGSSESAAYRVINHFVEADVITSAGKVKGAAAYTAREIIGALEGFAVRAGRRQRH